MCVCVVCYSLKFGENELFFSILKRKMTRYLCRSCSTSSLLLPGKKKKKKNAIRSSTESRRNAAQNVVFRREEDEKIREEEEMRMKSRTTTASPVTAERRKKTKKNVVVVRNGIMDDKNNASTGSSFYDPFERSRFQKIGDEIDRRLFFGGNDDASTSSSSSSPFFGLEEEFAKLDRELSDARERALLVGTEEGRRRRSAHEDFGPNKTVSKEISREHRGRHSYSNFRYAESVTTYGPSSPPLAAGRGSRQSLVDAPTLGVLLLLGTTYVYFKEKTTFARNFSATNFKEEEKEKLARAWPALYVSSEAFRREFRKAKEKEERKNETRKKETRDNDDDEDDRKN